MKRLRDLRRAKGVCINNEKHGESWAGGRCRDCWDKKQKAERALYAKRHP